MALTESDIKIVDLAEGEDPALKLEFQKGDAIATLTITLNFEGDFLSTVGLYDEDAEDLVRGDIAALVFRTLLDVTA